MKYSLKDLMDLEQFQRMQDRLNEIYAFPSAIIDNDGNILTATAWQDLCVQFHRKNKTSERHCIESDRYILEHLHEADPAVSYRCPHGLVDNALPIIIDGVHYGNFFTGQFFGEPPDLGFFKKQAQQYGFDEKAYLDAVKKVPIWSKKQVDGYLFFIRELIFVIIESGLKKVKEIEAREKIEGSEKKYRRLFENAQEGIFQTTVDGRYLSVNPALARMYGYENSGELMESRIDIAADVYADPHERDRFLRRMEKNGMVQGYEYEGKRKDGSIIWLYEDARAIRDDCGKILFFEGFVIDITARRRTESALREANQRWLIAAAAAGLGIWEHDLINDRLTWDDGVVRLFGIEGHQAGDLQTIWSRLIHPEDASRLEEELSQAIRGEKEHDSEFRIVRPDGQIRHIKTNALVERDEEDRPLRLVGVNYDITDIREKEEALRLQSLVLDQIHDQVTITTLDGRIKYINQAQEKAFGRAKLDVMGEKAAIFSGESDHAGRQKEIVDETLSLGEWRGEVVNDSAGNSPRIMNCRTKVIYDPFQKPMALCVVTSDITERRQAEETKEKLQLQLHQAQKMESVGRLAGGVAHDFNNMLGVILGHAEMAMMKLDARHPIVADLREIQNAGKRSADLTRQLLAFARKQTISPKVVNLNDTLGNMLNMLNRLVGENIDLVWTPGKNLWNVKMDTSQIDQILANLCVNARDAITETGRISIETSNVSIEEHVSQDKGLWEPKDFVRITVRDTGCGMDKSTLDRLFEPFFTTKPVGKGTGLGLATVYGIVDQNKGFIDVDSQVGQGTSFNVFLPKHLEVIKPINEEETLDACMHGNETVLLVEDDPGILNVVKMMLIDLGYQLFIAHTPLQAIELAREHARDIQLLITDVIMPEMNGRDLADRLAADLPGLKVLFMSGYTADVIAHHGVLDGNIHFLQKPFSRKELAVEVRSALDNLVLFLFLGTVLLNYCFLSYSFIHETCTNYV